MADKTERHFNIRDMVAQFDVFARLPQVIVEAAGRKDEQCITYSIEMRNTI